jgi:hypothetical protein
MHLKGEEEGEERERGMCRFYLLLLITAKTQWVFFYIYIFLFFDEKKKSLVIYSNLANKVLLCKCTFFDYFNNDGDKRGQQR